MRLQQALRKRLRRNVWHLINEHGIPTCLECGYDLRGAAGEVCSECGAAISAGAAAT